MKSETSVDAVLIDNTRNADRDCRWCGAKKGREVHSPACPLGERYRQVQAMGGVPYEAQR